MIRSKDIFLQQQETEYNYITKQPKKRTVMETNEEYIQPDKEEILKYLQMNEAKQKQQPKKRTVMNKKDQLNALYQECNLTKEDVYKHDYYIIITRTGIEKIQFAKGIKVSFQPIEVQRDFCVIKAIGELDGEVIETFGSAAKETSHNKYYMEMAEKRALSRVVLKLTKAYSLGVFGEEEADAFKQTVQSQKEQDARTNLKKLAKK